METETKEFIGYRAAAGYVGLKRTSLSSYVAAGIGPVIARREARGQYNLPVFTKEELDRWMRERPGQGARTDLTEAPA